MIDPLRFAAKLFFHSVLAHAGYRSFRFPLAVYVYLSFRCNLNCVYCDSGDGRSFPDRPYGELSLDQWKKLLPMLAGFSDVLLISGGEPLVHADPLGFLQAARKAGFKFISLNTNGTLLTPELVSAVDALIISLDSLDRNRSDLLWNRTGATDQVLSRLESLRGRDHPTVMVNCVLLPGQIHDAETVLDYCLERGLTFASAPAVFSKRLATGLTEDPSYHRFLNRLVAEKRAGKRIAGSIGFIRGIRRNPRYFCHPQLIWRVRPNGDLVFPCSRTNRVIGNLLETPDPIRLMKQASGGELFDPSCGEFCPLVCYMDTSMILTRPLELVREGLYRARTFPRGHRFIF